VKRGYGPQQDPGVLCDYGGGSPIKEGRKKEPKTTWLLKRIKNFKNKMIVIN